MLSGDGFPGGYLLIRNRAQGLYLTLTPGNRGIPSLALAREGFRSWRVDDEQHLVNREELGGYGRCALTVEVNSGRVVKASEPRIPIPPAVTIHSIGDAARATQWGTENGYIFEARNPDLVLTPGSKKSPVVLAGRGQPNQLWNIDPAD